MHSAASIAGLVGTLFASAAPLPAAPPLVGADRDRVVFVEEESTIVCGSSALLSHRLRLPRTAEAGSVGHGAFSDSILKAVCQTNVSSPFQ